MADKNNMSTPSLSTRAVNKAKDVWHNLRVRVVGTKANEKDWTDRGPEQFYWSSIDHPHRALLVKAVGGLSPNSVLEVGCNAGPNIYRMARDCPGIGRLDGIDLNEGAIREGQRNLEKEGITKAHLQLGRADDLSHYGNSSYDVVISDAVMIYIGKDKIIKVRDEMLRVAKKSIVLVEWHEDGAKAKGRYLYKKGYWVRDYRKLFEGAPNVREVRFTKITKDDWDDKSWIRYGYVVEVLKNNDG